MLARVKEDKMKLEIEKQNLDGVVSILDRDIKDLNAKLKVASETIERRDEVRKVCEVSAFKVNWCALNRRSHILNTLSK